MNRLYFENPFSISFGTTPGKYISRIAQSNEILGTFQSQSPSSQCYLITGIRGSGKTVFMTEISEELQKDNRWIVADLNPNTDMLQSLAARLCDLPEMKKLFIETNLSFSAFGAGVTLTGQPAAADAENAIEKMLRQLSDSGRRLLITIDEVMNTKNIRILISSFQIFLRKKMPVYLLMTGLYDNVYNLQNDKSLTFLYRAPKIILEPLSMTAIRNTYLEVFQTDETTVSEMARITMGYPFAFQVLGYLCWRAGGAESFHTVLPEYDRYLEDYVYDKIWAECSEMDRRIIRAILSADPPRISVVREALDISPQYFYRYKKRLIQKGILLPSEGERLIIALPRFCEFVKLQFME